MNLVADVLKRYRNNEETLSDGHFVGDTLYVELTATVVL